MRKNVITLLAALAVGMAAAAQSSPFGNSDPSPETDCGQYQWPEELLPCPNVQIKQKWDHMPAEAYRNEGWDTAITCNERTITLSCMPYIPAQYFNGQYTVDEIAYNPPDTTFYLNNKGKKMAITDDDVFAPDYTTIAFPFFFFGQQKSAFRLGDNGLVTFCPSSSFGTDKDCPWQIDDDATLPWPDYAPGGNAAYFNRMHDAIYGVYQDTYTGYNGAYMSGNQGIYYGVIGEFPCRKIMASWNEIPVYNVEDNRCTYQIVCYEGSNIIEVHVKRRGVNTNWQDGRGLIGIQNATGKPQTKGAVNSTTYGVIPNSPAAFWAKDHNLYLTSESKKAFRFTPQGTTSKEYYWYRILDNGEDVKLTTDHSDTNGYVTMMDAQSSCPTLTTAVIPQVKARQARYVFHLRFKDANDTTYMLYDTIVIGMDTANTTSLRAPGQPAGKKMLDICDGDTARLRVEMLPVQTPVNVTYRVKRVSMGQTCELDEHAVLDWSLFQSTDTIHYQNTLLVEPLQEDGTTKWQPITLNPGLPTDGLLGNKIDSIYVQSSIEYLSGCSNYDTILVRIFPNFDTTEVYKICRGESLRWTADNKIYTESAAVTADLKSSPGCDSIVHLDLTVLDVSHTVDHHEECTDYTWPLNGKTYSATNTATASVDTVVLQNIYGCDSVIQLDLKVTPLTARIQASRQYFDYDNTTIELNDISSGSNSRTWILPGDEQSTLPTVYYTLPVEEDQATIQLIARSPYGCIDTTGITLPMRKENFWMPNAFTPDSPNGNNTFGSTSQQTLTQQMLIYNRAGELVFSCDSPDCAWDGRDKNGKPCQQGTYVWLVSYTTTFEPMRTHVLKGTVTLIR
ncbi:MAG: gliding motility-associated C-terminal domain-containing protein [Bacteroidales bacterium]|nr:gliding motility-associated C-terminal domain-containing protein [Bacteroidales bacterium]